ncbi:MAG: hypothetical protein Ta2E_00010 [Mycoplasmoidaceae bacterium]|nr:MAG: hypothetical protein Ta2E_00010 [Mycoplasmoidaceae bacterium]
MQITLDKMKQWYNNQIEKFDAMMHMKDNLQPQSYGQKNEKFWKAKE